MGSNFWHRAMAVTEHHAELPFAVRTDDGAGTPTLLHGTIDLVYRTPEGWEMVDYKTDPVSVPALATTYAPQVRQYAAAWSRLTGTPVTFAGLFGIHHGEVSASLVVPSGSMNGQRGAS